jgi:hypothetical protein
MRTVALVLLLAGAIFAAPVAEQQLQENWIEDVIKVIEKLDTVIKPIGGGKRELAENWVDDVLKVIDTLAPIVIPLVTGGGKRELADNWVDDVLKVIDTLAATIVKQQVSSGSTPDDSWLQISSIITAAGHPAALLQC